jgi:hypothetical protein
VLAYKWLIHNFCDQRNERNLEIVNTIVSQKLNFSYFIPIKNYRSKLLLCHTLVRGRTARRQAAAKWPNY